MEMETSSPADKKHAVHETFTEGIWMLSNIYIVSALFFTLACDTEL